MANTARGPAIPFTERIRPFYGGIFALLCALSSELALRHFVDAKGALPTIGRVTMMFFSLYVIHRFATVSYRAYRPSFRDLMALTLLIFGSMLIIWLGKVLGFSLTTSSFAAGYLHDVSPASWNFMIPFAAASLVLQAILGLHYALVCSLSLAFIVGIYTPGEPILIPYVIATSLVAALSLSRFRSRSAYLRAGLNISLVALPFTLCSIITDGQIVTVDAAVRIIGALASGVLCAFIASGVTPLFEYFGGYVTDLRLIEMATLDHPLLKELSIQAPGTWNHSMVMGMMVESAADAVGANPVIARVGAYFHDIGKMKKPLYFVENQSPNENRHDKLSTSMSALIIRSHVKDGIELARKQRVPAIIEDMIPQHHGTSVIEYFYDKACAEAEANGLDVSTVDISLYTYPGPKPQTREAGILMLADGIEAASRTLSEPTLDRIQGLVQKMINKVFASGQLEESELTLRDLHHVAKSFTRVLSGIYHQRIAYAEPAEKVNEEDASAEEGSNDVGDSSSAKKQEVSGEERPGKEVSKEDLKRLGL
ncbi:MAG: HDIG domain-containing protein [Deltaproteobacteria bacterium]|nr:HDIG domain-containing protein [Deltaproteobacteria bacterium]